MKYFPRSLAAALQQLAADPKLRLSSQQENQIARSGYILVAVTSFLGDLRDSLVHCSVEIISEELIVMLRQLSYAINNQLKAPKAPSRGLWVP